MKSLEHVYGDQRDSYYAHHQRRADAVDEHVDYMRSTGDPWGSVGYIVEWDRVIEHFINHQQSIQRDSIGLEAAVNILETGSYNRVRIDVDEINRIIGGWNLSWPSDGKELRNAKETYLRRLFYAYLASQHAEVFDRVIEQDIVGLHGVQAIALPEVITSGALLSHRSQYEQAIRTGSGEPLVAAFRRAFVSFGSVHVPTAFGYSEKDIRSEKSLEYLKMHVEEYPGFRLRLDEIDKFNMYIEDRADDNEFIRYADEHRFGVVFGLARRALWEAGQNDLLGARVNVESDLDELCFRHRVDLSYTPVLFVPQNHEAVTANFTAGNFIQLPSEPIQIAQNRAYDAIRNYKNTTMY